MLKKPKEASYKGQRRAPTHALLVNKSSRKIIRKMGADIP